MIMNIKPWITTVSGAVVLSLALIAESADAAGYAYKSRHDVQPVYDYARVLNVQPVVRYVTVRTPVRECWEETQYYTVENRPAGIGGKTLFGAIVGGVIGHQFGSGRGNDAATVAGSLIGASVANSAARRQQGYSTTEYARPVTRCETRYQSREEERIDGYRVTYAYNGQKYATQMPHDPGQRIRIRVDVRPAP
jgi:uncharacterized protein YcfJ